MRVIEVSDIADALVALHDLTAAPEGTPRGRTADSGPRNQMISR
jgi:hypothetical protein